MLLDPATPAVDFRRPLNVVNMRYEEMKAFDQQMPYIEKACLRSMLATASCIPLRRYALQEAPAGEAQSSLGAGLHGQVSMAAPGITSAPASATLLSPVHLQTACFWAKGFTGQLLLRVVLDTGTQRTFIGRDFSRALACPIKGTQQVSLITFGRNRPKIIQCNLDSVTLKEISIVSSPSVNGDVLRSLGSRCLSAADCHRSDTFLEDQVSIFIGSDFYWKSPREVSGA